MLLYLILSAVVITLYNWNWRQLQTPESSRQSLMHWESSTKILHSLPLPYIKRLHCNNCFLTLTSLWNLDFKVFRTRYLSVRPLCANVLEYFMILCKLRSGVNNGLRSRKRKRTNFANKCSMFLKNGFIMFNTPCFICRYTKKVEYLNVPPLWWTLKISRHSVNVEPEKSRPKQSRLSTCYIWFDNLFISHIASMKFSIIRFRSSITKVSCSVINVGSSKHQHKLHNIYCKIKKY